jgi:hypothetical protein
MVRRLAQVDDTGQAPEFATLRCNLDVVRGGPRFARHESSVGRTAYAGLEGGLPSVPRQTAPTGTTISAFACASGVMQTRRPVPDYRKLGRDQSRWRRGLFLMALVFCTLA